ncbi:MAG: flagellar hook-length control protein FliK [Beijerinckiaceae bacterium]
MAISSLIQDLGSSVQAASAARKKSIASPKDKRAFGQALTEVQNQPSSERANSVQRSLRRDATPVARIDDRNLRRNDDALRAERGTPRPEATRPEGARPDAPVRSKEQPGQVNGADRASDVKNTSAPEQTSSTPNSAGADGKATVEKVSAEKVTAGKIEAEKAETIAADLTQQAIVAVQPTPVQAALTEAPPLEIQAAALAAVQAVTTKPIKTIRELPVDILKEGEDAAATGAGDAASPASNAAVPVAGATLQKIEQTGTTQGVAGIAAEAPSVDALKASQDTQGPSATLTKPDANAGVKSDAPAEQKPDAIAPADQAGKTAPAENRDASQSALSATAREAAQLIDQVKSTGSGPALAAISAPAAAEQAQTLKAATPAESLARADSPVPLQAVAVEIGLRAVHGSKEFSIRLDPEELGRIDIRLEISKEGEVQAKLVVDRVETLQLLQRDAKTLERAFDQAGLKTNPDGLQFSLRDPGQQNRNGQQHEPQSNGRIADRIEFEKPLIDDIALRTFRYRGPASGSLDISI